MFLVVQFLKVRKRDFVLVYSQLLYSHILLDFVTRIYLIMIKNALSAPSVC